MKPPLSRREREVVAILHRIGPATGRQIRDELQNPPSYSAVRSTLRILVEKGHLTHEARGQTYLYRPRVGRRKAARQALGRLLETFFDGSQSQLVAALVDRGAEAEELDRIAALIDVARGAPEDRHTDPPSKDSNTGVGE